MPIEETLSSLAVLSLIIRAAGSFIHPHAASLVDIFKDAVRVYAKYADEQGPRASILACALGGLSCLVVAASQELAPYCWSDGLEILPHLWQFARGACIVRHHTFTLIKMNSIFRLNLSNTGFSA